MLIERYKKGYMAWHTIRGGKVYEYGRTRIEAIRKIMKLL